MEIFTARLLIERRKLISNLKTLPQSTQRPSRVLIGKYVNSNVLLVLQL